MGSKATTTPSCTCPLGLVASALKMCLSDTKIGIVHSKKLASQQYVNYHHTERSDLPCSTVNITIQSIFEEPDLRRDALDTTISLRVLATKLVWCIALSIWLWISLKKIDVLWQRGWQFLTSKKHVDWCAICGKFTLCGIRYDSLTKQVPIRVYTRPRTPRDWM